MSDFSNQSPIFEPLTERELEVLQLLVDGFSNPEIAHELVISVGTVKWHNRQIYSKLYVKSRTQAIARARELGLLHDGESTITAPPLVTPRHNLPATITPIIGRKTEQQELIEWIQTQPTRLITILGPGGMGKTRLALEIAWYFVNEKHNRLFTNGVFFVPLAQLSDPAHIVTTIAERLGKQFHGTDEPEQQVLNYFSEKQMLLVLDNFEHLLDGARLISAILQAAPHIHVLTTSREKLNLGGEAVFTLGGLHFLKWETPEDALEYAAVRLFMQSACLARSDFTLQADDLAYMSRICQLVQGMPLAILLAAAWVEVLTLREIADEIEHSIDFLEGKRRDVPERQRSIRAVFEHSWKRLSEDQQEIYQKLSVFRGGFTRYAAQRITGADIRTILSLTNKSLLTRVHETRFDIHELLRQYTKEKLEVSDNVDIIRNNHRKYYLNALAELEADIKGRRQIDALDEIVSDFENIRIAWLWAVEQRHDEAMDKALESLLWFCIIGDRYQEGRFLLSEAYERLTSQVDIAPHPLWARIITRIALLDRWQLGYIANPERTRDRLNIALEIAQERGDRAESAITLFALAEVENTLQNYADAIRLMQDSLAFFSALDDKFYQAWVLHMMGQVYSSMGQPTQNIESLNQAVNLRQSIGDVMGLIFAAANRGGILIFLGQYDEAETYLRSNRQYEPRTVNLAMSGITKGGLALLAFLNGILEPALEMATEALTLGTDTNVVLAKTWALTTLGLIACIEEKYREARQLCDQSQALAVRRSSLLFVDWGLSMAACGLAEYDVARKHQYRALQYASATHAIGLMTWCLPVSTILLAHEEQIEWAVTVLGLAFTHPASAIGWMGKWPLLTRLRVELEAELGTEAYEVAWEQGKSLDLETVVTALLAEYEDL